AGSSSRTFAVAGCPRTERRGRSSKLDRRARSAVRRSQKHFRSSNLSALRRWGCDHVRMRPDDIIQRAEVLGDRVNGHPEHCGEVLPELLRMLPETDDPEVLTALVEALGHAWHKDAAAALLP